MAEGVKGFFSTVHVKGEDEGEIEPQFYEEFKGELGRMWLLYDSKGLRQLVEFNDDYGVPRIRIGWPNLRRHYEFTGHHPIFFNYLGNNQFLIIPTEKPITPAEFPTWHTQTRSLRKAVTFNVTMQYYDPEYMPFLILPTKMGRYLSETMLDEIFIVGTNGEKHQCHLKYDKDPFVVLIDRGWKECVGINDFKNGDMLSFNISNIYADHTMRVTKLS